jgi:hypothetical protein
MIRASILALLIAAGAPAWAASCESLTALSLADTTITSAQTVAAAKSLPSVCRVAATLKPSSDSDDTRTGFGSLDLVSKNPISLHSLRCRVFMTALLPVRNNAWSAREVP